MANDYIIQRLISSLGSLSNRELYQLVDIFTKRNVAKIFSKIIHEIIYLREVENKIKRKHSLKSVPVRKRKEVLLSDGIVTPSEILQYPTEIIKNNFCEVLNNKSSLPSTRDVIEILNKSFPFNLRYESFRRRGRRDLIERCWKYLEETSSEKRHKMLTNFFRLTYKKSIGSEGYHELFRILSQNE